MISVKAKPTENETELRLVKILKELQLDTMGVEFVDKGDYDSDVEYLTAKLHWAEVQIRRLLISDKQKLLQELKEEGKMVVGNVFDPCGKYVSVEVIQNKLEGLS
jgi:hypothetical protein